MLLKRNDSKRTNKLNILQLARHAEETTKPELAKTLGISMPTSSSLVDELIGEGFLKISGVGASTEQGGKKPKLITVNPVGRFAAALHIGARQVEGAVVDLLGGLHHRIAEPLPPHPSQQTVGSTLAAVAGRVLKLAHGSGMPVVGIGVGLPGLVVRHLGSTTAVNFAEVNGLRIDRELESFGLPVWIDNECRNSALAEQWFGLGKRKRNFISLFTDGGIGAGLLIDGHMVRGMDESFGEVGHTVVQMGGRPCRCGNRGCWETYASSDALLANVRECLPGSNWLNARVQDGEPLTVRLVAQAVEHGDAGALLAAIDELGDYLAVGLGNIVNLFNPELIVIHGEMTMLGERLLGRVRQSMQGKALPAAASRAEIRFTGFGEHANLIGAGSLAWKEAFDQPELLFP
ncbi:ROK family protein [Paenibacillus sp. MBLB4367]|uniref:ROK family protein n=1 Tax=Paenibacillus sp. MBLB4367 TaxID=3384767 RepID=UPI0039083381